MNCPHCGFLNQEGRKYCRGCAKALAAPPAITPSEPAPADAQLDESAVQASAVDSSSVQSSSVQSSSAQPPIADRPTERSFESNSSSASAPASGISRNVIVIAIAAVLVIAIAGGAFWFLHKGGNDTSAQAAPAQTPVANAAYHPDAAAQKTHEEVLAALRLIVARQEARLAEDPDDFNVCAVNVFGNDDVGTHARESHYIFDQQCEPLTADGRAIRKGFTITATPKVEDNPADAPTYCVDQTRIIRRYTDSSEVNNATSVQHLTCPLDGQPLQ